MTSKLKCPVCPYCDKLLHCGGTQYINERIVAMWHCQNAECEETEDLIGTREMWEIVANKIQAKQDLEIARKALEKLICEYNRCRRDEFEGVDINWEWWVMAAKNTVETALKQIKHKE